MENSSNKNRIMDAILLGTGIVLGILLCLPFLINGKASIITYHDQLDGELLTYIFSAKYLFSNVSTYPEIMNGIPKQGLMPPAPIFVILYKIFNPFVAIIITEFVVKLVAFVAMFLLLRKLNINSYISFIMAAAFMSIPFYPVYGLCIPLMPGVIYAYLCMKDKPDIKKGIIASIIVFLYTGASSLALCGFAVIIAAVIITIISIIKYGKGKHLLWLIILDIVLCLGYVLFNVSLVLQILGLDAGFVTHKTEMVTVGVRIIDTFKNVMLGGLIYADGGHKYFLLIMVVGLIMSAIFIVKDKEKNNEKDKLIKALILIIANVIIALLIAIYSSSFFANIRNASTGVLRTFNFSRIGWLSPVIWYVAYALIADCLICLYKDKKVIKYIALVVITLGVLVTAGFNTYNSDVKPNVMKILKHGDYYMLTWDQFFAEDLFKKVDEVIGRPKEEYRVVSLGIYPSAAAYNGFYCLDAYSNNYDVEYKHKFRRVIAPELEKSDYLRTWYDDWGNRCYIVLAESNDYFTFEKRWSPCSNSVDIDTSALKSMGCEYIISASYIMDPESIGLSLMTEDPIMSENSWYRLWVYRIE